MLKRKTVYKDNTFTKSDFIYYFELKDVLSKDVKNSITPKYMKEWLYTNFFDNNEHIIPKNEQTEKDKINGFKISLGKVKLAYRLKGFLEKCGVEFNIQNKKGQEVHVNRFQSQFMKEKVESGYSQLVAIDEDEEIGKMPKKDKQLYDIISKYILSYFNNTIQLKNLNFGTNLYPRLTKFHFENSYYLKFFKSTKNGPNALTKLQKKIKNETVLISSLIKKQKAYKRFVHQRYNTEIKSKTTSNNLNYYKRADSRYTDPEKIKDLPIFKINDDELLIYIIDFECAATLQDIAYPVEVGVVMCALKKSPLIKGQKLQKIKQEVKNEKEEEENEDKFKSDYVGIRYLDFYHKIICPGPIPIHHRKTIDFNIHNIHGIKPMESKDKRHFHQIWESLTDFLDCKNMRDIERTILIANNPHCEKKSFEFLIQKTNSSRYFNFSNNIFDVKELLRTIKQKPKLHEFDIDRLISFLPNNKYKNSEEKCKIHQRKNFYLHCGLQDCYSIYNWLEDCITSDYNIKDKKEEKKANEDKQNYKVFVKNLNISKEDEEKSKKDWGDESDGDDFFNQ